jgi:hypothetical protein
MNCVLSKPLVAGLRVVVATDLSVQHKPMGGRDPAVCISVRQGEKAAETERDLVRLETFEQRLVGMEILDKSSVSLFRWAL